MADLSRNEKIRALVVSIHRLYPDKRVLVNEDILNGQCTWSVQVDGLGHFEGDFATDVLAQVRAAVGADELDTAALVAELLENTKAAKTSPKLGPAAISLAPGDVAAPAAALAPVPAPTIDYAKLAAEVVKAQAAAPAKPQ